VIRTRTIQIAGCIFVVDHTIKVCPIEVTGSLDQVVDLVKDSFRKTKSLIIESNSSIVVTNVDRLVTTCQGTI
jgi:hypothetical protein